MDAQRFLHSVRIGLKSLALHKLRSTLTLSGVVFGVSSVVVMLAIGEGARQEAIQQIQQLGVTNILLESVKPTDVLPDNQATGAIRYGLMYEDVQQILAIPTVSSVTPNRAHRKRLRFQDRELEGHVVGVFPEFQALNRLKLGRGRFIETLDLRSSAPVAVLGAQVRTQLFPFEDPIGRSIRIGEDRYFQVVGVISPRGLPPDLVGGSPGEDYNRNIYIPFTSDRVRFGAALSPDRGGPELPERVQISQITVAVDEANQVRQTAQIVDQLMRNSHQQADVSMTVPLELLEQAERTQRIFTIVLGSIASISLLVGGIGIMNIMLATVTERTREIGVRRALGATRGDIHWQFLLETIVLAGSGGVIGLVAGIGLTHVIEYFSEMNTVIRLWAPLLAFVISITIGLIFGLYPAKRAARMDPIEALRHD